MARSNPLLVPAIALASLLTPGLAPAAANPVAVPFEMIDNRVFVEARIDGRGPYHFIVDSGSDGTTMNQAVAPALGIKAHSVEPMHGVGETTESGGNASIPLLQIGSFSFRDSPVLLAPEDWSNVFGSKPVDGVVGLTLFKGMAVRHDYVHRLLSFIPAEHFEYSGPGQSVPFEQPDGIPVVSATLDGVQGHFGIDTGARSSLLLYRPFVERNGLEAKYGAHFQGVTGWGVGGPVRSLLARAQELRIGDGVTVRDLVVRLSTQKSGLTTSTELDGLIGPDVLSQFDVTFDYQRQRIVFEPNANYGRRDSYDRAGVWMGQAGTKFTALDVIPDGPAAAAGVSVGDTILAIDGRRTDDLVLPDVRERIRRGKVGDKMVLLLQSQGKEKTAVVTLRDLV